jgi:hypothetical protein
MARMRFGVHRALEREADRLIRESLKDVRRPSEIDVMTPWKSADRKRREIMVSSGTPDASIRSGMFHRSANRGRPDLNARDGIARSSGPTRGFSDSTGSSPYGSSVGSMSPDGMGLSLGEILGQDDGE